MNLHGKDIKIFTANANPRVAAEIAQQLGLPLGQSEVVTFSDGEISVSIKESVRGSDVFVVQSLSSPVNDNLMELLIMIDAFKRASAGRITAVIPYLGYARQDRKAKARDPISAKLVADLITTAGADRVLSMDLHCPQIQGFFNIPVDLFVYMLVFFALGFLVYAFLYAAVGSTASKMEDINTSVLPITFLFIIAFMIVVFAMAGGNVDTTLMKICSYIPFISPMAMFTRICMSTVAWYEIAISIAVLIGSTVGIGFLSAKIYRVGVLLYGRKPTIVSIFKEIRKA